tara:strand:- start:924 stop:1961 length:1038 start_codon:yes stop_codon:yes gene_type:complete
MKKILIIDDGIEFDSITVREKPSGGAENAFVSMVEAISKFYKIKVFNNCKNVGYHEGVVWEKLSSKIENEKFDVLIINRGDKYLNFRSACKNRIFWIHNPAKYLLKYRYLSKLFFNPTKIIFSSEYHLKTYPKWAPSKKRYIIPYGIDNLFLNSVKINKPKKPIAIFTSNPLRGLDWLLDRWENEIISKVPEAELHLYSGIETYGNFGSKHSNKILSILQRAKQLRNLGVHLFKPLERSELKKKILNARIFLYQGSKEETFCMAVAEAQTLGLPTVVCDYGCMNERVKNNITGFVCDNNFSFSNNSVRLLKNENLWKQINKNIKKNNECNKSWDEIAILWKKIIN